MVPWDLHEKFKLLNLPFNALHNLSPNHFLISYLKSFSEADIITDFRWLILIIFKLLLHSECPSYSFLLIQILPILQIQFKSQLFMNLIWHYLYWNYKCNISYQQKIIYFLIQSFKTVLCVYIFSSNNRPIIYPQSFVYYSRKY